METSYPDWDKLGATVMKPAQQPWGHTRVAIVVIKNSGISQIIYCVKHTIIILNNYSNEIVAR